MSCHKMMVLESMNVPLTIIIMHGAKTFFNCFIKEVGLPIRKRFYFLVNPNINVFHTRTSPTRQK